jgi:hypothetical protein
LQTIGGRHDLGKDGRPKGWVRKKENKEEKQKVTNKKKKEVDDGIDTLTPRELLERERALLRREMELIEGIRRKERDLLKLKEIHQELDNIADGEEPGARC